MHGAYNNSFRGKEGTMAELLKMHFSTGWYKESVVLEAAGNSVCLTSADE
jgi:hypothetical protein